MAELGIFDGSRMKPSKYAYIRPGWWKFKIVAVDSPETASDWKQPDSVVLTLDVECLSGPDKGNLQQIKIWENGTFVLGSIMVAAGIKLPAGNFRLKQEHLMGKGFYGQCDDRPSKKAGEEDKVYTNFSRFEPLSFVPPTAAAPAAETATKPDPKKPAAAPAADDDGIEEITEDDLG